MPKVAIIMGSVSDLEVVKPAIDILKKQYRSYYLRGGKGGSFGRRHSSVHTVAGNRTSRKEFDHGRIGFAFVYGADAVGHTGSLRCYQRRLERRTFGDTDTFDKVSQPYEKNARL